MANTYSPSGSRRTITSFLVFRRVKTHDLFPVMFAVSIENLMSNLSFSLPTARMLVENLMRDKHL